MPEDAETTQGAEVATQGAEEPVAAEAAGEEAPSGPSAEELQAQLEEAIQRADALKKQLADRDRKITELSRRAAETAALERKLAEMNKNITALATALLAEEEAEYQPPSKRQLYEQALKATETAPAAQQPATAEQMLWSGRITELLDSAGVDGNNPPEEIADDMNAAAALWAAGDLEGSYRTVKAAVKRLAEDKGAAQQAARKQEAEARQLMARQLAADRGTPQGAGRRFASDEEFIEAFGKGEVDDFARAQKVLQKMLKGG